MWDFLVKSTTLRPTIPHKNTLAEKRVFTFTNKKHVRVRVVYKQKTRSKERKYLSSKPPTTVKIGRNQEIPQLWDTAYNLWRK
jgi:hypothetical protein